MAGLPTVTKYIRTKGGRGKPREVRVKVNPMGGAKRRKHK